MTTITTSAHSGGFSELVFHPNCEEIDILTCGADGQIRRLQGSSLKVSDFCPEVQMHEGALRTIAVSAKVCLIRGLP
jgi:WD40 repeat protein